MWWISNKKVECFKKQFTVQPEKMNLQPNGQVFKQKRLNLKPKRWIFQNTVVEFPTRKVEFSTKNLIFNEQIWLFYQSVEY